MGDNLKTPRLFPAAALIHFPATYIAALLGVLASAAIILIYPPAGEQSSLVGHLAGEPIWLPEIISGLFWGMFFYRRVPSTLAFLAWLPQGAFLFWSASTWYRTMATYDSTWHTYFGKNCGGSECLYELFLTMPLYTGISYTVGALLTRLWSDPSSRLAT